MNAPNVTPGDWETGSLRRQVVVWPEGWNAPLCIADCGAKHAPESEAERCANARLIAKAKNLAEALDDELDALRTWQSGLDDPGAYAEAVPDVLGGIAISIEKIETALRAAGYNARIASTD